MRVETRHAIFILASLLLLIGQLGCASGSRLLPPPPSAQVRATLGTIGVVSARLVPEATVESPTSGKGSGAAKGAAAGFFGTAAGLGQSGLWYLAIFPPAALVLGGVVLTGGVVGGVYGAVAAEDAAKVQEAETALKGVLAAERVQEAMGDRVFRVAREQTRHRFVVLERPSPPALDEGASYRSLASEGIDTILEINAPIVGLGGESGINPPLAVVMTVRTRLVRVGDVAPIYEATFEYKASARTFTEWAVNNAQPFRVGLDHAYQSLAEKIVEELFLLYLPMGAQSEEDEVSKPPGVQPAYIDPGERKIRPF
jgi:hypothetical protein